MNILAIETSCDETACAVVQNGTEIISNVVASSAKMHEKYGGIIPELAAREQLRCIIPVIKEALAQALGVHNPSKQSFQGDPLKTLIQQSVDALAVTVGPGLIGSLLVGVETAKTIAFVTDKPIIPVNHVIAHMYANVIDSSSFIVHSKTKNHEPLTMNHEPIEFPAISLVASGGHTELYLMKSVKDVAWLGGTIDDAAGEAFDKTARLLGFGSRGGVAIEAAASKYQISNIKYQIKLPRPMIGDKSLNFSFSGLKTAILREVNKLKSLQQFNNVTIQQLAYEVQEAITDVLVEKTMRASKQYGAKSILLSGGVAANSRLREKFNSRLTTHSMLLFAPPQSLCTDNAVYIASCAFFRGKPTDWRGITAIPDLSVETTAQ